MEQVQDKLHKEINNTFSQAVKFIEGFEKGQYDQRKNSFKIIVFNKNESQTDDVITAPIENIGDKEMKYKGITIRKRKNENRWYARIRTNGTYKFVYGKTQLICLDKLKTAIKEIKENPTQKSSYTVSEWLDKWTELYKIGKITAGSQKINLSLRKNYIDNKIGKLPIQKISSMQIMELLQGITASRQRQKVYTLLHDAFNKATLNKIIKENPMLTVDKPKHEQKENRALTLEEQQRFIQACKNNPCGDYFLVTLFQGLRRGETFNIETIDIDLEKETLNICQKDSKRYRLKTKGSRRTLPLFKNTKEIIIKYMDTPGKLFSFSEVKIYKEFKIICDNAKIKNATIHTLRHTFITRCIEANIPLKVVQAWAGHTTSKMTNEVYTHINTEFNMKCKNDFDSTFDTLFKDKKNK